MQASWEVLFDVLSVRSVEGEECFSGRTDSLALVVL